MKTEQRTFDNPAQVTHVTRYSPAERNGLVAGDLVLSFGAHSPAEILENSEIAATLKRGDWLLMRRGDVAFRLAIGEGLEGCTFEATTAAENVTMPSSGQWNNYWGGVQSTGSMVLVPDHISWVWALTPPLLYARFHNWQMLSAISLVWTIAFVEGPVTFVLSYLIAVAVALVGGSGMLVDASKKEGYAARGTYGLASYKSAAALELITAQRFRENNARRPPKPPIHAEAQANG
jgi:hypothetical protein